MAERRIEVRCSCGKPYRVRAELRGMRVACRACGGSFVAEPGEDAPATPAPRPFQDDLPADPEGAGSGVLYLISARITERVAEAPEGAERMRDAWLVRSPGALRYVFRYSTVLMETVAYASVAEAVRAIEAFEASPREIDGASATYRWLSLRPHGGPEPCEEVARILLCEAEQGAVGRTEREAVYERFLDFGEHSVAISPAGIAIAGEAPPEQVEVYLYYVAQIAAASTRYAANEEVLDEVMVDIRARAADFDVERLQQINISTSKAMLDISDELLDIPPRESFILKALLEVANIDVYEQRISRMLGIVQHHVSHRHALVAKRNSQRIEFVLFIIAVLGGLTGLSGMLVDAMELVRSPAQALAIAGGVVAVTIASAVGFYRVRGRAEG